MHTIKCHLTLPYLRTKEQVGEGKHLQNKTIFCHYPATEVDFSLVTGMEMAEMGQCGSQLQLDTIVLSTGMFLFLFFLECLVKKIFLLPWLVLILEVSVY